jgi:hypothetical protein
VESNGPIPKVDTSPLLLLLPGKRKADAIATASKKRRIDGFYFFEQEKLEELRIASKAAFEDMWKTLCSKRRVKYTVSKTNQTKRLLTYIM